MLSVSSCIALGIAIHAVLASGSGHSDFVVSTDYTSRYHGPGTTPVVLPDGTLANTPEVAAARAAHLAALQKAQALWYGTNTESGLNSYGSHAGSSSGDHYRTHSGSYSGVHSGTQPGSHSRSYDAGKAGSYENAWSSYSGHLASAVVLPSGYLADSSDVAAAKVAHLGAVAQAYAEAAKWPSETGYNQGWKQW